MPTPLCPVCHKSNWPNQAWMHRECEAFAEVATPVALVAPAPKKAATNKSPKTANRRDRKAYNAYQRTYMANRRAKANEA